MLDIEIMEDWEFLVAMNCVPLLRQPQLMY